VGKSGVAVSWLREVILLSSKKSCIVCLKFALLNFSLLSTLNFPENGIKTLCSLCSSGCDGEMSVVLSFEREWFKVDIVVL